jgi:hypothetical protein
MIFGKMTPTEEPVEEPPRVFAQTMEEASCPLAAFPVAEARLGAKPVSSVSA